jgi:hypothetical protein
MKNVTKYEAPRYVIYCCLLSHPSNLFCTGQTKGEGGGAARQMPRVLRHHWNNRKHGARNLSCITLGCRREVHEKNVRLGYCAASSGNFLTTFRENL